MHKPRENPNSKSKKYRHNAYMSNLSRIDIMRENFKDIGLALIVGLALAVLALSYFDVLTK